MATYVLVHGAWHGSWEWEALTPLLEEGGHRVLAVDLPRTSLDDIVATIRDAVESAEEPAILVGHSAGGMWITQTAEEIPERIAKLVYVAAFLPRDGQALVDLAGDDIVQTNLIVDEAAGTALVAESVHREAFYGECPDEVAAAASARHIPEAFAPFATPVRITEERGGSVPRVYIECMRDNAMLIGKQRAMQAAMPCQQVLTIDTDHCPSLSDPRELADHLLSLA
ncbi:MAG TPA: alpha/beta fold hydrolase [Gaiellaceae bacterium]|nr:alpha/beta fold hydrolase [Gaiellaceae bacterium]